MIRQAPVRLDKARAIATGGWSNIRRMPLMNHDGLVAIITKPRPKPAMVTIMDTMPRRL
jgi:hypothetical protein